MKQKWIISLIIGLCALLAGCSSDTVEEENGNYKIYYINNTESKIVSESYQSEKQNKEELARELLDQLGTTPSNLSYKQTIPEGIEVTKIVAGDDEDLSLIFNTSYLDLSGIKELLVRAAIVKTLCQIKGVKEIEFFIQDIGLTDSDGNAIGKMNESMFVDTSDKSFNTNQYEGITLYFANEAGDALVTTYIPMLEDENILPLERVIMNLLIGGPQSIENIDKTAYATLNEESVCNRITTTGGICYVDLNDKFLKGLDSVSSTVAVYSIVNSLTELSTVSKVQITINGESIMKFGDFPNLDQLLSRDYQYVESED